MNHVGFTVFGEVVIFCLAVVIPTPTSSMGNPFSSELLLGFLLCFVCLGGIMFLDLHLLRKLTV